ncbi:MAG TPA: hypothetical protein VKB67_00270 [Rhizomicrobium sp.]|nr:hypothetical protein [Rhizomicrobium sp.]
MTANKLRAVATAFLLGTAVISGGVLIASMPAQAAVSAKVGKPLQEAQALAEQGNYKAAMAKVNEAEAVPNKTAEESKIIAQMKEYIAVKSGDTSTPSGAKAKFANDYNARKYKEVIEDSEALKKNNVLDAASMQVVAQAYYLSGDKQGCLKYIKSNFGANPSSDATLQLQMSCAHDSGDDAAERAALEALVAHTGKTEYWNNLLKMSERGQGMRDHDTLDVYRLKLLTGTISGADEYTTLAQLALQLGFPAEAAAVIEKGQAAKVMTGDRVTKLLTLAKTQAAADEANMAKNLAAAQAAPKGDALVKIGEDQWGQGKAKDAVATIKAGIAKGVDDKNNAQIRLGMALIGAGQKADAQKALDVVKGPDTDKSAMVAHLWSLYARH